MWNNPAAWVFFEKIPPPKSGEKGEEGRLLGKRFGKLMGFDHPESQKNRSFTYSFGEHKAVEDEFSLQKWVIFSTSMMVGEWVRLET